MQSLGTQNALPLPLPSDPHPCAPRAFQSSQHLFPAQLSKWEILLSPLFPKISGNPGTSILKCVASGNTLSSFFALKMYFNDLVIRIFSVFYTKVLKLTIYLLASFHEILDDMGIASSWLRVPGLYSSPVQIALNSADRVN